MNWAKRRISFRSAAERSAAARFKSGNNSHPGASCSPSARNSTLVLVKLGEGLKFGVSGLAPSALHVGELPLRQPQMAGNVPPRRNPAYSRVFPEPRASGIERGIKVVHDSLTPVSTVTIISRQDDGAILGLYRIHLPKERGLPSRRSLDSESCRGGGPETGRPAGG